MVGVKVITPTSEEAVRASTLLSKLVGKKEIMSYRAFAFGFIVSPLERIESTKDDTVTRATYSFPQSLLYFECVPQLVLCEALYLFNSNPNPIAACVSSPRGNILKPFLITRIESGKRADFSATSSLVSAVASYPDEISLIFSEVRMRENSILLEETEMFCGSFATLPTRLYCYKAVCEAALTKLRCLGCSHIHYGINTRSKTKVGRHAK